MPNRVTDRPSWVADTEIGSEERNEVSDNDLLGLKASKQLGARQPRRGVTEARGGGAEPERKEKQTKNGTEALTKRNLGVFYMHSGREEGNVDNAVRNNGGGISMVQRAQKPANGESEPNYW
jgi:hypothetical protein